MTSARPVVTVDVVRKVAELARLRLPEEDLPRWTEQLSRILAYIDQLAGIREAAFGPARSGPATPIRKDEAVAGAGLEALEANAPRQVHGYGVVPRVVGSGS